MKTLLYAPVSLIAVCPNLFLSCFLSVLVDKDNSPKWNPSTLRGVSKEKVDSYFETLGDRELVL